MSEISSRVLYAGATVKAGEGDVNGVNRIGYRERVRDRNTGPGVTMKADRKRQEGLPRPPAHADVSPDPGRACAREHGV